VQPDQFRDLAATNVTGYLLSASAVVPAMLQPGLGTVNVSINESTMRRARFTPLRP
jgi:NADP-dependent 3-hydroxy acid dehydrogenase YdfG